MRKRLYQINFVVLELCFNIFLINCRLAVENFFTNFFWGFTKFLDHMSCIFFTFVFDFCDFMFRKPYKFLNRALRRVQKLRFSMDILFFHSIHIHHISPADKEIENFLHFTIRKAKQPTIERLNSKL